MREQLELTKQKSRGQVICKETEILKFGIQEAKVIILPAPLFHYNNSSITVHKLCRHFSRSCYAHFFYCHISNLIFLKLYLFIFKCISNANKCLYCLCDLVRNAYAVLIRFIVSSLYITDGTVPKLLSRGNPHLSRSDARRGQRQK